ncbi:MAG: hypothetical protein JXJ17_12785 [Anaerolineae bacterium]|nr:hypothetical protein [Anaerolineae bacterium]
MSDDKKTTNSLLDQHKAALMEYRKWDEKVKMLLKGRRVKDLTRKDMVAYQEAARQRDMAYDQMRHFERALLDDIPGAATGQFPHLDLPGSNTES